MVIWSNDMSNVLTLDTVQEIEKAISEAKNPTVKAILQKLLETKKREAELAEKVAKKTSNKFTDDEAIIKAVFVALRPYTHNKDSNSVKAFKAVINELNNKFDKKLQESFFSTSILHCAKSNLNKAKSVYESISSYKEAVKQSQLLLPLIEDGTWSDWEKSMYNIAKTIVKKRNQTWKEPVQAEAVQAEAVQAEAVQAEAVQAEAVQAEAVQDKKIVITRKNKRK